MAESGKVVTLEEVDHEKAGVREDTRGLSIGRATLRVGEPTLVTDADTLKAIDAGVPGFKLTSKNATKAEVEQAAVTVGENDAAAAAEANA